MAGYKDTSGNALSSTTPAGFTLCVYPAPTQAEQKEQNQSGQEEQLDKRVPLTFFEQDLRRLINAHSLENTSNTPDSILAEYLCGCLNAFNIAIEQRERWYGRKVF